MKKQLPLITLLFSTVLLLSSCEAIGAIFKAGVWTGIFVVAIILALVIFVISRLGGKK